MAGFFRTLSGGALNQRRIAEMGFGRDPGGAIQTSIFFILFYLYLWFCLDLHLIYYSAGMIAPFPVFFRGEAFFQQFIYYPGGPVEYFAAFLAQFFYYSWTAALLVTLQAGLLCLCTGCFLNAIHVPRLRCLRFIIPIFLLILCSQYIYYFAATTSISAALLFLCLYLKITPPSRGESSDGKTAASVGRGRSIQAASVFLILSILLYYIAGGAYLFFAVLCAISELIRRRYFHMFLFLVSAVMVPYVQGVLIFSVNPANAYTASLPAFWKAFYSDNLLSLYTLVYSICIITLIILLVLMRWYLFRHDPTRKKNTGTGTDYRSTSDSSAGKFIPGRRVEIYKWVVHSLLLYVIAGAAAFFFHHINSKRENQLTVHYYACRRMWPQLLDTAGRKADIHVVNVINRALFYTGKLGSEMFLHPQHSDALLITGQDGDFMFWSVFDTPLDLGLVNLAQRNFSECLESYGEHPLFLKRLALIAMVKRDIGAAKIYLGALTKTLFHADWAREYLARLQVDPELLTDDRIQHLRSVCLQFEFPDIYIPGEMIYAQLITENRKNKMAFEYLMTSYLLGRQPEKLVEYIGRMEEFNDIPLPRHYQEAICICDYINSKPIDLAGYGIDPHIKNQLFDCNRLISQYGGNKEAAIHAVYKGHGDSYFFYYLYGFSGAKR